VKQNERDTIKLQKQLEETEKEKETEKKILNERLAEKENKLQEANKKELEIRKEKNKLEEEKRNFELEKQRQLDEERKKISEEASKKAIEEQRYVIAQLQKKLTDATKANDEMARKLEQGSQQTQGEVLELELEEILKTEFPYNEIIPVPKGVRGADVLQKVYTKRETLCGIILWETKRTKNWNEGWVAKLKEDQREAKADIAVLVTEILPKDISNFGHRNNIWITNRSSLLGLAFALQAILTQVAITKLAAEGKDEKIELLFRYLTGPEFRQRVEAMIETFIAMKQELDKDKRVTMVRWGKQDKHIERVIAVTAGMHGDLKGLIGTSMQSIPSLESGEEEIVEDENPKMEDEGKAEVDLKNSLF